MAAKNYQPVKRSTHSTIKVGDYLYMWVGWQPGLPAVHDSDKKKSMSSVMEVCHLASGRWEQKPTTGTPPLGIRGYAAAAIGNEIFYYGGWCSHPSCYHNSLFSFNVDTFNWKELSPTTPHHGPWMKWHCGMVALQLDGEDYLVVIGGTAGSCYDNTPEQPGAQYEHGGFCNEIHYYKLSSDEWITPTVTRDRPPPISEFTLTSVTNNTAVLLGGVTTYGRVNNNVYIINFTKTSVNCTMLSNPGGSVQWPKGRYAHSSVLINNSTGPHLLVVGGLGASDSWLFDINKRIWKEMVNIPYTVAGRSYHSLSVWSVTPTANWIIVFGGSDDTQVIELRYIRNDWSTSEIPLDQYQEKLQRRRREWEASHHQNERREIEQLRRTLQEKEKELQEEKREKEKVRTRLQQQLQEKDRQITDKDQRLTETQRRLQSREREYQEREQQGQERERQLQEAAREREQNLQQQLQQSQQQLQEREQQFQERERQLQQSREREQNLQEQLQQAQQQSQERERHLQQQLRERDQQERESSWVVHRNDVIMTDKVLGRGGWGEVRVAHFHGLDVAAKVLHDTIISDYNVSLFAREMNIASKIRHPNLLQFIGATREGNPIILTELMPTSLRKELETAGLAYPAILSISIDVACALNYLHLFKPHPILHRDVSSANVLLLSIGNSWRAKVSDYGSANLQHLILKSDNPGGPLYAAPEAGNSKEHSPAMDVFSYGVLLIEMISRRIPQPGEREGLINDIRRASFKSLVQRCLIVEYIQRPTMTDIITELNETL